MCRNILGIGLMLLTICSLGACGAAGQQTEVADALRSSGYEADGHEDSGYGEGASENHEDSGYGEAGGGSGSYRKDGFEESGHEGGYEADGQDSGNREVGGESYESVERTQIKMITDNTEVVITLNNSRAAAELAAMLPLELTLIERNRFAKGMTLPAHLAAEEETTREYEIGDFGYWDAGPDLAIFYDDIYEQTIVEVIPLGHAETGAETMAEETGTVRLELVIEEGDRKENE